MPVRDEERHRVVHQALQPVAQVVLAVHHACGVGVEEARSIFDLMPTETAEHWQNIAGRMSQVPAAFAGMRESWKLGIDRGVVTSRRQALASAGQLDE
ncbi:MAG: DUF885 family protein, partial [Actinomycetota bacterium]